MQSFYFVDLIIVIKMLNIVRDKERKKVVKFPTTGPKLFVYDYGNCFIQVLSAMMYTCT